MDLYINTFDPKAVDLYINTFDPKTVDLSSYAFDPKTAGLYIYTFDLKTVDLDIMPLIPRLWIFTPLKGLLGCFGAFVSCMLIHPPWFHNRALTSTGNSGQPDMFLGQLGCPIAPPQLTYNYYGAKVVRCLVRLYL